VKYWACGHEFDGEELTDDMTVETKWQTDKDLLVGEQPRFYGVKRQKQELFMITKPRWCPNWYVFPDIVLLLD